MEHRAYETVLKPILFKMDPEAMHDFFTAFGRGLASNAVTRNLIKSMYSYQHPMLHVRAKGIDFPNPVGLAAGFDKNAKLIRIIPCVGFGFEEVGSITAHACAGNPRPRLFRLPKDKALIINYGLANEGVQTISKRIRATKKEIPLGISIAKTNDPAIKGNASVDDYYTSFQKLKNLGDYVTINISCPNTGDGRSFEDPVLLEKLLKRLRKTKPVFLKISPDLSQERLDAIIELCMKYHIDGLILTNLTHDRSTLKTSKEFLSGKKGGISGKPVREKSLNTLRYVYRKTQGKLILISVGGISTAEDAYKCIKNGATLVQLITGMIYHGPSTIKQINKGLVRFLKRDGYKNIGEAVGVENIY
jgi:dihydroorotate dehydrogenase